jgi:hypothetical protein
VVTVAELDLEGARLALDELDHQADDGPIAAGDAMTPPPRQGGRKPGLGAALSPEPQEKPGGRP